MTTGLCVNSHLFTPVRVLDPDEDLAVCVQTPRAFSADMVSAEGLERALSATAEQSEPRTPFDGSDQVRTMREEEEQARVRWWAEDDADLDQKEPNFCSDKASALFGGGGGGGLLLPPGGHAAPTATTPSIQRLRLRSLRRRRRPSTRRCASTFRDSACGAARRRRSARAARPRRRRSRCA
jgi:hypothetical protein